MISKPPYADDWQGLAAVAERLRDDRARGDPDQVKAQRLTPQQAADRARVSNALALQWRAIAQREPIPMLEATHSEIRLDLETAAAATARRAASDPRTRMRLGVGEVAYSAFAEAVAALLWQQQPYRDGAETPHILFVHEINQAWKAERARRPAPAASAKPAPPPARPLRQPGLL